ncbi:uncharacterized protein LOC135688487 [Rhopilema esculentum]|uniref:uncharacterized protein LOC135688487 n=1 Tax=Rhopilema esculentum TaxID=499914 RepID=UPI0031E14DDF
MWHYFVAHVIYYITRCFPKDNRRAVRLFCTFTALVFLIPQFVVLTMDTTSRYCGSPLLEMLVLSIATTFAMIAFGFLFTMMEPVPWKLRLSFHFFGAFSFLVGILHFSYAVTGRDCEKTTTSLYYLSISFGIFGLTTMLFFAFLLPFWIIEFLCQGRVLNRKERRGICYEPVSNCPCLWRV